MLHLRRSRVLVLALALVFALTCVPATAYASINDMPPNELGTSSTNPFNEERDYWWRLGWGNSLYPQFELALPQGTSADTPPQVLGALYVVDRSFATEIDETRPQDYDHAWDPAGTWLSHSLDIRGIYGSSPVAFAATEAGARLPFEGQWWFHWSFFDTSEVASRTITGPFGIDVTPPLPVAKLNSKPYQSYSGPTGVWFPDTRAYVVWEDKEYDALSGTGAYEVYVNDVLVAFPDGRPKYVYHLGHTFTSATIEDLPPGKNRITVKTVDRATNTAPGVTTYFYSDPDTPTVDVTFPPADGLVGRNAVFTANATDGAGIQYVEFLVDGATIGKDTTAPYSLAKDMIAYANGSHTLQVKAKDMYGRVASQSRAFTLDKTAPSLSSISDTSDPFYPIIQEGYKDTSTVSFYTNEKVYAYVHYYKANGQLFTSRSATRGPGWASIVWDGRNSKGEVGIGDYRYRVAVKDAAGNETWSGTYLSTIRDYELVRIAPNAVKVIPR